MALAAAAAPPRWSWAALRRWFRPPRRLRFSRAGALFTGGSLILGLAATGTGNNLLYLVLGAMLGFITLSGWLSEQMIRGLEVKRRSTHGLTAGVAGRISYEVRNRKRRLPSLALELGETGGSGSAWIPVLEAGELATPRTTALFPRRGVYPLSSITLATSFPFGLFRKERDLEVQGEAVVWPRHDRVLREPRPSGERIRRAGESFAGAAGARGEYRGLRPYRPGDDPRDVHWRTTARLGHPVVREYERDRSSALWICLDTRGDDGPEAEVAVEIAASLAAAGSRRGEAFALALPGVRVPPGVGAPQLERVLDALARCQFSRAAVQPQPPVPVRECVLVTSRGAAETGWGDVFSVAREGQ